MAGLGHYLDEAIGVFAPRLALRRQMARRAGQIMASVHKGADTGRRHGSWSIAGGSADADIIYELPALRARSRDLVANDGYAAGVVSTIVSNVVGTGLRPQSRIDARAAGLSADEAETLQSAMEDVWAEWAEECDVTGRQDFYGLQRQAFNQIVVNGDVLGLVRWKGNAPRVQLVEADRLGDPISRPELRGGVELDEDGRPIAYHVRKTHPGDRSYAAGSMHQYERVPARDGEGRPVVCHLYRQERPGQNRGKPWLTPVLSLFKDMSEYQEAELVAARVAACFALFVTKNDAAWAMFANLQSTNDAGQRIEGLEPGMIEYLEPGETISTFNPQRPGVTFDMFMIRLLRAIAAAMDLPYEIVARDYSQVNYSSARAAILEARKLFRVYQQWFARSFCQVFWDWVMEWAWLQGRLPVADFYGKRRALLRTAWFGDGWEWVDPVKEVQASIDAIDANLTTLSEELALRGRDLDETLAAREREKRKAREAGLVDQKTESEIDERLARIGLRLSENDARRRYGRPAPDGDELTPAPPRAPQQEDAPDA